MATEQRHFLLLPYSEQGHINPMLSLAFQLLRLGCRVTFVNAEKQASTASTADNGAPTAASSATQDRLRFVTLPAKSNAPSLDPKTMTRHQIFKHTLAGLQDRQELVASIIEGSKASSFPITCIICDLFLWKWVRHVARAHRLRSAVLCVTCALTFYRLYLESIGKVNMENHFINLDRYVNKPCILDNTIVDEGDKGKDLEEDHWLARAILKKKKHVISTTTKAFNDEHEVVIDVFVCGLASKVALLDQKRTIVVVCNTHEQRDVEAICWRAHERTKPNLDSQENQGEPQILEIPPKGVEESSQDIASIIMKERMKKNTSGV